MRTGPTDVVDTATGVAGGDRHSDHWREFGRLVLAAHHRHGLGAQCGCGSLMVYCPVVIAADRLGLPTDDPRGRALAAFAPHRLPGITDQSRSDAG